MKPRALVLKVAGTNCDLETCKAFEMAGADWALVHINELIGGSVRMDDFNIIALPGGFSYGDDISAARVLATKIKARLFDDFLRAINRGAPIIGICNGFQVLIKMGLLPGDDIGPATLFFNDSYKFEDRWVWLRPEESGCVFTQDIDEPIYLPVAHLEGKYVAGEADLEKLEKNDRVVFRYAAADGCPADGAFPENPNGSLNDIAGITDKTGLILGMMPHPERHLDGTNHPRWTREGIDAQGDGVIIFRKAVEFVRNA